jgi:hypothetical protein
VRGNYASLNEFFQQVQRLQFEVAESTQPAQELQLGWLSRTKSALLARPAPYRRASPTRLSLGLPAEASITEEPGAGKLHAGTCAGAVG